MWQNVDLEEALYRWLGIPLREQPPNHYRLLGLALFEHDASVIESAADRQMAHVRSLAGGPNSATSQRVLNALSAAKLCLLDERQRAQYDAALRSELALAQVPTGVAPVAQAGSISVRPAEKRRRAQQPSELTPTPAKPIPHTLIWAGVAVVGLLFFFMFAAHAVRLAFMAREDERKEVAVADEHDAVLRVESGPALIDEESKPTSSMNSSTRPLEPPANEAARAVVPSPIAEPLPQQPPPVEKPVPAARMPEKEPPQVVSPPPPEAPSPAIATPVGTTHVIELAIDKEGNGMLRLGSHGSLETERSRHGKAWQYGYGEFAPEENRVKQFSPLPYFSGSEWRGAAVLPDAQLGWVTLNAAGGHPGNDQQHAAIRRWTAPKAGFVSVAGKLLHNQKGDRDIDGVRARIVSSRSGLVGEWQVTMSEATTDTAKIEVQRGDVLDFIVDCLSIFEFDAYQWKVGLTLADSLNQTLDRWDSFVDFQGGEAIAKPMPGLDGAEVFQLPDSCHRIVYDFGKVTGEIPWIDKHTMIDKGELVLKPVDYDGRLVSSCWPGRSIRLPIHISLAANALPDNLQIRLEPGPSQDGYLGLATKDGSFLLAWYPTGKQERVLVTGREPDNSVQEWAFSAPFMSGADSRWALHIAHKYDQRDSELLKFSKIEITGRLVGMLGIGTEQKNGRIVVNKVMAGYPAEKAGIKVGDTIVSLNDTPIRTAKAFLKAVSKLDIGDSVKLSIQRDGSSQEFTIVAE